MSYYLIVSKSLTQAQRIARALERAGIAAEVSRSPRKISENGCGFGVKIQEQALAASLRALGSAGIGHNRIFLLTPDGGSREVQL